MVGAVAYGAYKIGKLRERAKYYDGPSFDFDTWNTRRQADGFLCRNNNDCRWLDNNLGCAQVATFGWAINVS